MNPGALLDSFSEAHLLARVAKKDAEAAKEQAKKDAETARLAAIESKRQAEIDKKRQKAIDEAAAKAKEAEARYQALSKGQKEE